MTRHASGRGLRPHQLRAVLKQSPPAPLYFCVGEEPYLMAQALDSLRSATVGPDDLFNYQRFDAGDVPVTEMLTAIDTLPAFAERRLVVISRAESLTADAQAALLAALDTSPPTTCLAITACKVDQRRRLFAWLNQHATPINCQPLLERELPAWLLNQAAAWHLQLAPDVVQALLDQTGSSLHALVNELEKLQWHAGRPAGSTRITITLEQLRTVAARERDRSIFELTDAVGQRRSAEALSIVRRLLDQGEQPVGLTMMLTRHLRRLLLAKAACDAGATPADLARRLSVAPRYAETLGRQIAGFTRAELQQAMTDCLTADAQLKGGRAPKDLVIDGLILELCGAMPGPLMVTP
jgi:DNA polymerase-3 subunit delta